MRMSKINPEFTTIDGCLNKVGDNRFKLAVIVSQRAEEVNSSGAAICSDRKGTVIALQELSQGLLDVDAVKEKIITSLQKNKRYAQASIEEQDTQVSQDLGAFDEQDQLELKEYMLSESDLSLSEDELELLEGEQEK